MNMRFLELSEYEKDKLSKRDQIKLAEKTTLDNETLVNFRKFTENEFSSNYPRESKIVL